MEVRPLGTTGLVVSVLGLGCGPLGDASLDDGEAERLVHAALDQGVTLFDTAPSYGASEARLGRALAGRRDRAVIVTKGGYGVPGVADWTPDVLARGIDQALVRLATDHLDVFLLHSCDRERAGSLAETLVRARDSGKVRAVGYSGDGEALGWAIRSGEFDVVECSVNVFDQRALDADVPEAARRGVGVLAKRAMANAPWRDATRPAREDAAIYWDRMNAMMPLARGVVAWDEMAVRFSTHAPGVASALIGTRSVSHLERALENAGRGPLPTEQLGELRARFEAVGAGWPGLI